MVKQCRIDRLLSLSQVVVPGQVEGFAHSHLLIKLYLKRKYRPHRMYGQRALLGKARSLFVTALDLSTVDSLAHSNKMFHQA